MAEFSNIEMRPTLVRRKSDASLGGGWEVDVAVELYKEGALDLGGPG